MHEYDHLELGQALDGLQRPQDTENPQGLDGLNIPALVSSAEKPQGITGRGELKRWSHYCINKAGGKGREVGKRLETGSE